MKIFDINERRDSREIDDTLPLSLSLSRLDIEIDAESISGRKIDRGVSGCDLM